MHDNESYIHYGPHKSIPLDLRSHKFIYLITNMKFSESNRTFIEHILTTKPKYSNVDIPEIYFLIPFLDLIGNVAWKASYGHLTMLFDINLYGYETACVKSLFQIYIWINNIPYVPACSLPLYNNYDPPERNQLPIEEQSHHGYCLDNVYNQYNYLPGSFCPSYSVPKDQSSSQLAHSNSSVVTAPQRAWPNALNYVHQDHLSTKILAESRLPVNGNLENASTSTISLNPHFGPETNNSFYGSNYIFFPPNIYSQYKAHVPTEQSLIIPDKGEAASLNEIKVDDFSEPKPIIENGLKSNPPTNSTSSKKKGLKSTRTAKLSLNSQTPPKGVRLEKKKQAYRVLTYDSNHKIDKSFSIVKFGADRALYLATSCIPKSRRNK